MVACIHGNLCRAILNRTGYIYSKRCPNRCEFYEPKHNNEDKTCTMLMTGYPRYECSLCGNIVNTANGNKPINKMSREELVNYINKLNITLFKIVDNQGCETRDDDN